MEMFEWLMTAFVVGCGLIVLVKFMKTENVTSNTDLKDKVDSKDFDIGPEDYDEDNEDLENALFAGAAGLEVGPNGELPLPIPDDED